MFDDFVMKLRKFGMYHIGGRVLKLQYITISLLFHGVTIHLPSEMSYH